MNTESIRKLMRLPVEQLIEKPNCGLKCPKDKPFSCGCEKCWKNGKSYYEFGEQNLRFSKEDIKLIESLWDEATGWMREKECIFSMMGRRDLMSWLCLRFICSECRREDIDG